MIKLFIVGFPMDIQEAELIELFSNHGMLHSITLLNDRATGKPKGYGFVEMLDKAGADRTIVALNGMVIRGRKIRVKLADEHKVQKPPSVDFKRGSFSPQQDPRRNVICAEAIQQRQNPI